MFGIDESCFSARFLHFGDHMESDGRLTGGFRSENFDYSAARHAADSKCEVKRKRPGRNRFDLHIHVITEAHYDSFTLLLFKLGKRGFKCFFLVI